jgi:signal transduction histidine kinase
MVEVYGWTITEEGEQDKGAKFVITIPKVIQGKSSPVISTEKHFESN